MLSVWFTRSSRFGLLRQILAHLNFQDVTQIFGTPKLSGLGLLRQILALQNFLGVTKDSQRVGGEGCQPKGDQSIFPSQWSVRSVNTGSCYIRKRSRSSYWSSIRLNSVSQGISYCSWSEIFQNAAKLYVSRVWATFEILGEVVLPTT
jgi:hypothetical protein